MSVRTEVTLPIKEWTGINTSASPSVIDDSELMDCVNFDVSNKGTLLKRKGWQVQSLVNDDDEEVHIIGAWTYIHPSSFLRSFQVLAVAINYNPDLGESTAYLYRSNFDVTSWTLVTDSIAFSAYTRFVVYNNKGYICNGASIYEWDGVDLDAVAAGGDGPIAIYKDRLFGIVALSGKVFYSDIADFTSWQPDGFFLVDPDLSDPLQDLLVYQDRLIIFKKYSTWALTVNGPPENWYLRKINGELGSWQGACEVVGDIIYFTSHKGVYVSDAVTFKCISEGLSDFDGVSELTPETQLSVVEKKVIVTALEKMFVYHTVADAWTRYHIGVGTENNVLLSNIVHVKSPGGVTKEYLAGTWKTATYTEENMQSEVWKLATTVQDSRLEAPFTNKSFFYTKRYNLQSPESQKRNKYTIIELSADWDSEDNDIETDLLFRYIYNEQLSNDYPGNRQSVDHILDPVRGSRAYKTVGAGYFRELQIYVEDSGTVDLEVLGINLVIHGKRNVIPRQT